MISVSGKRWQEKKVNKNILDKLKQDYNFSDLLSKLIISRNFDESEIHSIENPLDLPNVFSNNKDFLDAIQLVLESINNNENICVLGDYDLFLFLSLL